jgi:hypothetical protein
MGLTYLWLLFGTCFGINKEVRSGTCVEFPGTVRTAGIDRLDEVLTPELWTEPDEMIGIMQVHPDIQVLQKNISAGSVIVPEDGLWRG